VLTKSLVTIQNLPGGAYLEETGQVVMEAENGDISNGATHTWLRLTYQSGYVVAWSVGRLVSWSVTDWTN
jgi:hypothetical protein